MNTPRSVERPSRAAVASSAWPSARSLGRLLLVATLLLAGSTTASAENGFSNENVGAHDHAHDPPLASPPSNTLPPSANPSPGDPAKSPRLTLAPPDETAAKSEKTPPAGSWTGMIAAAIVAGGATVALWFLKPTAGVSNGRPPEEVLMVLGRAPLGDRQTLQVVRFGGKLLLVNVAAGGSRTLSEIDDPDEVERLERLCRGETKRAPAAASAPSMALPKRSSRMREAADA